jgi:hypothetical protein
MITNYTKAVAPTFEEAVRQQERRISPLTVKHSDAWEHEPHEHFMTMDYEWVQPPKRRGTNH